MIYINNERKQVLNPLLAQVSERIESRSDLVYCLTMLACREIRGITFSELSSIFGDIQLVALEFWRRIIIPYEIAKARENGDVFLHPSREASHGGNNLPSDDPGHPTNAR